MKAKKRRESDATLSCWATLRNRIAMHQGWHEKMVRRRHWRGIVCVGLMLCSCLVTYGQSPATTDADAFDDPKVVAAIIAATTSLAIAVLGILVSTITAIWSYFTSRRSEIEIETLKAKLAEQHAERDARRDYEYEARKRLYGEYEPLLFQLIELSEDGMHRVYSLARTAHNGDLLESGDGWLRRHGYYMTSTIYKLLAPAAIFRLMRQRLTLVDLTMDPKIAVQYTLAKILYLSLTCDYELAEIEPAIEYMPNADGWNSLREENPNKYWRQGLALGRFDNVLDDLLAEDEGRQRLRTFAEYENFVNADRESDRYISSHDVFDIFRGFHSRTRPILWRICVVQAHLHRLIMRRIDYGAIYPASTAVKSISIPPSERSPFDWRSSDSKVPDSLVLEEPFDVATNFIGRYIEQLLPQTGVIPWRETP